MASEWAKREILTITGVIDDLTPNLSSYMAEGGPPPSAEELEGARSIIALTVDALTSISSELRLSSPETSGPDWDQLVPRLADAFIAIRRLNELQSNFALRLLEMTLIGYIRLSCPWLLVVLLAVGVVSDETYTFDWDKLEGLTQDPWGHLLREQGLSESSSTYDFARALLPFLSRILPAPLRGVPVIDDDRVVFRVFFSFDDTGYFEIGVTRSDGRLELGISGDYSEDWTAGELTGHVQVSGSLSTFDPRLTVQLSSSYGQATSERKILWGSPGHTRVEVAEIRATVGCAVDARGAAPEVGLVCRDGQLIFTASDIGSFLSSFVGGSEITVGFGFELSVSKEGVRLNGGVSLELSSPARRELFPGFTLLGSRLAIQLGGRGLDIAASTGLEVTLGPVKAAVDRLGIRFQLSPSNGTGVFGILDLQIGLVAPTGLSVVVDAGPVHGGGFISYDASAGRYVGAVSLSIGEIALSAFGILDTRAPGVPGYSFLIVVSARFTPIQLGFGFTLNGVGGLCGIQRAVSVEALQAGVRDGSLAPLLFCDNPVSRSSQLVTSMQRIFPPTRDRYVFGPMFKLGWGTPTLLTVDIGIILQLPAPIIIALIGTLSASLPRPEAAVVVLNIDIVGVLDTGEKRLSIDASLRDSRVGPFALTGDLALRLQWGNEPDFALSLGGFNPSFTPPPSFPQLRRLALSLGSGSNPRISLSAYFALTSNTLQVGARAELYAEAAGFNVLGYVEFHALFIFSPFSFRFNFAAGVALRRGTTVLAGVSVMGQIDGPRPWHVKGSASITILFFDVSVDFDTTFGDRPTPEQIETIDVWARLQPALQDVRNWSATLPVGRSRGVTVASDQEVPARVRLDPMSELAVRQKVLPLDRRLTKLGEGRIDGPVRYRVSAVRIGAGTDGRGGETVSPQPVEEPFAPGQYETLTDAQRLSRPSFEPMPAGVKIQGAAATTAGAAGLMARTIRCRSFRASIAGDDPGASRSVAARLQAQMQSASAAQLTAMRSTGMERYAMAPGASPLVTLAPQTWTLASTDTLSGAAGTTGTWGQAADAMRSRLEADPSQQGALQIAPTFETRP